MFYSLADFGNDALSLGFGYSLGGWIGADYYYTSSGSFGFSSQISPWFWSRIGIEGWINN